MNAADAETGGERLQPPGRGRRSLAMPDRRRWTEGGTDGERDRSPSVGERLLRRWVSPLYGAPVDPRVLAAFRKQTAALERGLALFNPPVERQTIPFEGGAMPAYFLPATGFAGRKRPSHHLHQWLRPRRSPTCYSPGIAARRRGYHSLVFDGPGQGAMPVENGVPLRPDWEMVVTAVVDFALTLPEVDPARIALSGWSLGGYLAPRAVFGRVSARPCIADPAPCGPREWTGVERGRLNQLPTRSSPCGIAAELSRH